MRRLCLLAAGLSCLWAAAPVPAAKFPKLPPPEMTCTFSGPPDNVLTFTTETGEDTLLLRRAGDEIKLYSETIVGFRPKRGKTRWRRVMQSPSCPTTPTVSNVDQVSVFIQADEIVDLDVSLQQGPFAPGATAEPDGSPEIELNFQLSELDQTVWFVGGPGPDSFAFGALGEAIGANLNAASETTLDVDASVRIVQTGPFISENNGDWPVLAAKGKGGDDSLVTPGAGFENGWARSVLLSGGSGDDRLTGVTSQRYSAFKGGPGNDLIETGLRFNEIRAGGGNDTVVGGPGREIGDLGKGRDIAITRGNKDALNAIDNRADVVRCGSQKDVVGRDGKDRVPGCERRFTRQDLRRRDG